MSQALTVEDVEGFFERYGWAYDDIDEQTLRTAFRGDHGNFTALVRVTEHWVVFTVNPYIGPPDSGWGRASLTTLAAANQHVHLAKLGIDFDDDVFLTVELPTEGFTFEQFDEALSALATAADGYIVPLLQARAIDERNA
jgi:hypothetical protein